ncbi:helix-turn-helix domain-containing protein [Alkalicoccobacillus plakortidis]|uniref:Helix-turn-helix domain-containing protein n=1 Tax=Alkalicoccobacillus plakortidis TaxID=444060 RepID=A0ABT0XIR8_9BACI|nr:helix-turn-helix transcriptional regulator [Alkalicoccobacillus plakortidis]MCM2675610.1 helix-turn-helix domain-containing protein [Alkalicoccobacillus plakortidis]
MGMTLTPKALRVNSGKTQEDVANHLELSLTAYKRKENNQTRWYADELAKLAVFYKVDIGIFFKPKVSYKDTKEVSEVGGR